MGLFSSEYRTTVGTTVSRVVRDATIIASTKTGLITSLFGEDGDQLVETILDNVLGGMGVRVERMYTYAQTNFPVGLQTGKVTTSVDGAAIVLEVIRSLTAPGVTLSYYHLGPLNNLHVGWVKLFSNYGYNSVTNQLATLSASVGYPVYLKDMVAVVKEATVAERSNGSLEQWGTAAKAGVTPDRPAVSAYVKQKMLPTPFHVDPDIEDDYVKVTYMWAVPTSVTTNGVTIIGHTSHEASINLDLTGYDREQDYFQIKYKNGSQEGYWIYQHGLGTYPTIDAIFEYPSNSPGEFFPNIYFRQGTTNIGADVNTDEYKAATRMLDIVGIDFKTICDSIHENPDIATVEQALLTFAVPANTVNPIERRYLFDFFSKLYTASGGVGVGPDWDVSGVDTAFPAAMTSNNTDYLVALSRNEVGFMGKPRVRINFQDTRLKTALSCQSIFKRNLSGVVAAIGEYTSSFTTRPFDYTYTVNEQIGVNGSNEPIYGDVLHSASKDIDVFVYAKQITNTVYEEIVVYDLQMTYYMWGGYLTIGDNLSPILLVPLDHAITGSYSTPDKELLYTRAMHYVFNSRVVNEVKWYQQGWFADLLIAVAMVVTVASMGADGGMSTQLAALAAGTLTVTAFITYVAMAVVKQVAWAVAAKLFVQTVGMDVAFIAAIVAVIYGGYSAVKAGSIQGAPWAKELLAVSSAISSGISSVTADAMAGLKREADAFNLLAREKMTLLDDASKLLDQQTLLSPLLIFGESPDDFYNRTVHSGNIGILGIDSITSYVDIALTLPTLNDSIGSNNYGLSV